MKDFRDPAADRTFVRMATCIPMKPDSAEKVAPRANAPAVFRPNSTAFGFPAATAEPKMAPAKTMARMMAMTAMLRYCRRRKARAPCWIAAVISRIRSLPVSLRRTSLVRRPANPRPAKIAIGMMMLRSICAIVSSPSPDPRRNFLRVLGLDGLTRRTSERGSKGRAGGSSRPVPGPGRGTRGPRSVRRTSGPRPRGPPPRRS